MENSKADENLIMRRDSVALQSMDKDDLELAAKALRSGAPVSSPLGIAKSGGSTVLRVPSKGR